MNGTTNTQQEVPLAIQPATIADPINQSDLVKPGTLFKATAPCVTYRQRFSPSTANLYWLGGGEYDLPPDSQSGRLCHATEESLIFLWQGNVAVEVSARTYELAPYDTLYIPRGAEFQISNLNSESARVIQCSATAENVHPVHHSRFAQYSRREDRVRRLNGKDVFMMFDVTEAADKLIAGYTFFQPYQRSWPPHNHTDQEEVYIFIKGHGSMEVYESPEKLCFVHSVSEGDLVTIPMLNYHPVFSQESPLEFIWCIAGERYWVGDKNKDFMAGKGDSITT